MKIALDLRRIGNPGIGRYMRCLTEALLSAAPQHNYLLILPPEAVDNIETSRANVEKIAAEIPYYSFREQVQIPSILRRYGADLLHAPHFNVPLVCPCPRVVTIHDVIYLACREDLPSAAGRMYYKGMMSAAVRLAGRIITDSEFSKSQIRRFFGDAREIEVIYPGVDERFHRVTDRTRIEQMQTRYGIRGDYILYTGIFKPRKNHIGLLRAFRRFLQLGGDAHLVIAGPMADGETQLRQVAEELRIAARVVFPGFVKDSDLSVLYSGARAYACPSLYEGFGFTVLEAMACGVPVVCSEESSLPEVAGTAALYADARNADKFGQAMYRVITDGALQRALVEKGFAHVRRFEWRSAAMHTLAVYEQVVEAQRKTSLTYHKRFAPRNWSRKGASR